MKNNKLLAFFHIFPVLKVSFN